MSTLTEARVACDQVAALLRYDPHVTGVGLAPSAGGWSVKVNVDADDDATRRRLPARVDGVPVVVALVGPCKILTPGR